MDRGGALGISTGGGGGAVGEGASTGGGMLAREGGVAVVGLGLPALPARMHAPGNPYSRCETSEFTMVAWKQ